MSLGRISWGYSLHSLGFAFLIAIPASLAAQSDNSLDEAYAAQCKTNPDKQACQVLRSAIDARMQGGAATSTNSQATVSRISTNIQAQGWGFYARLPGTVWRDEDSNTIRRYTWKSPGEIMLMEVVKDTHLSRHFLTRTADNKIEFLYNDGSKSYMSFPRAGVGVLQASENTRSTWTFSPNLIRGVSEESDNGNWRRTGNVLRRPATNADFEAMKNAITATWGDYASLPGTTWRDDDDGWLHRFYWQKPGEVMIMDSVGPYTSFRNTIRRTASGRIEYVYDDGSKGTMTFPRAGVVAIEAPGKIRDTYQFSDDFISSTRERFKNGTWRQELKWTRRPSTNDEFKSQIRIISELWGDIRKLRGKDFVGNFYGSTYYISFYRQFDGITLFRSKFDEEKGLAYHIYFDSSKNRFRIGDIYNGNLGQGYKFFKHIDGSFGFEGHRYRLLPNGNLEVTKGKWNENGPTFEAREVPEIWRPFSDAENTQRLAQIRQRKANGGGDSGLLGGLAFGIGAAMAGGNAEQVMGATMKGVEMTTDDEMTRQSVSGVGDEFLANGTRRVAEQVAAHNARVQNASGSSVSRGSTPTATQTASSGMTSAPRQSGAGTGGGEPLSFYYLVGLVPGPNNTRNPGCYSEVVNSGIRIDGSQWGAGQKIAEVVERYRSRFISECSRRGQITSVNNVSYMDNIIQKHGWGNIPHNARHPEDVYVRID